MLKLSIVGQDSLARVTQECCAKHFDLTARNPGEYDIIWCAWDTPLGAGLTAATSTGTDESPNTEWVIDAIARVAHVVAANPGPLLLISSQIPVGSTARLEAEFPAVTFAYSPENIRVAHGVADFMEQARVVVGRRSTFHDDKLRELFAPFTDTLILTDIETSECVKHFLNIWLSLNIVFANEMSRFCGVVGADAQAVSKALLKERRVSSNAPLKPGAPYGGGHLARDIYTVNRIAREKGLVLPVISRIKESNES